MLLIVGYILSEQYHYIANSVAFLFFYLIVLFFERKNYIRISEMVKVLLMFIMILHVAFGQYFGLYVSNPFFDKGLHFIGTFTVALFLYQGLISYINIRVSSKILAIFLISSLGISGGVLLELFEFVLDILFNSNNQKDLFDTNVDMLFNVIGGVVAGVIQVSRKV